MKTKLFIISIYILLSFCQSHAQSLSYDDLINLQKNNVSKAIDFFNYKGWTLNKGYEYTLNTYQDGPVEIGWYFLNYNYNYSNNGYDLYDISCNMNRWVNGNGEQAEHLTPSILSLEFESIIIYYTSSVHFFDLVTEAKKHLNHFATKTDNNSWESFYRGGNIEIIFYQDTWLSSEEGKTTEHTTFQIRVLNYNDIRKIKTHLCNNCGGKGEVWSNDYKHKEICPVCNGSKLSLIGLAIEKQTQDSIAAADLEDSLAAAENLLNCEKFTGKWSEDGTIKKEVFEITLINGVFHIESNMLYNGTKTEWNVTISIVYSDSIECRPPNEATGKKTILKIENDVLQISNLYGKNLVLKKIK